MSIRLIYPCRVNELSPSRMRGCLSLNGQWDFIPDPLRSFTPSKVQRLARMRQLRVPGCWEAQGVGGAGMLTRTSFSADRFRGTYRGLGWYRKCFDYQCAPRNLIWLKMGVIHSKAEVYLNGCYVGKLSRTIGAYRFDITKICKPNANVLIIAMDNDLPPSGGAGDAMGVMGGLTQGVEIEQTAPAWIAEARVTGDVKRHNATGRIKIVGADKEAQYKIKLTARLLSGRAAKHTVEFSFHAPAKNGAVDLPFALPIPKAVLWSPETPALYALTVQLLCNDAVIDEYISRFGFRSLSVRGTRIYLNNHPFFMAGCGTMTNNPMTVSPLTDRAALRREFRRMKAYGFVYIRYHTETPYDELFDAADETGMLIQAENRPFQGKSNEPVQAGGEIEFSHDAAMETDAEAQWYIRETALIHEHFGNHPSLAVYCMGNEYYDNKLKCREQWRKAVKAMDATRLVISSEGNYHYHPKADDYMAGFLNDCQALRAVPVVLHEFINLPTLPDVREIPRFKGGMLVPESLRCYLAWARRNRINTNCLHNLSVASHKLQEAHLKYNIEKARSIPGIQGYGIWRYHDFWHFPTRIGIVTVHGADKDRRPADLRAYNGQTVLLTNLAHDNMEMAGMPTGKRDLEIYGSKRVESVCACGESVNLKFFMAHAGANHIQNGEISWKVMAEGAVLKSGKIRAVVCKSGALAHCRGISWKIPDRGVPCKVRIEAKLISSAVTTANNWSMWAFPKTAPILDKNCLHYGAAADYFPIAASVKQTFSSDDFIGQEKKIILVTDSLAYPGIKEFIVNGGRVLLVAARDFTSQAIIAHPGWWSAGAHRFTGAAIKRHPVFQDWPGAEYADWPMARFFMSKENYEFPERLESKPLPTTIVPVFERLSFAHDAIVYGVRSVQESFTSARSHFRFGWMPYMFETRIGKGRLFGCVLRLTNDALVGNWLANAIVKYMLSNDFNPASQTRWSDVFSARVREVALNRPAYYYRAAVTNCIFMHGIRKPVGYTLFSNLSPNKHLQTLNIGRYWPLQCPKTAFIDLQAQYRITCVQINNVVGGNAKNIRVSLGQDQTEWHSLGSQRFQAKRSHKLSFSCPGIPARFVRIECLDSYQKTDSTDCPKIQGKISSRVAMQSLGFEPGRNIQLGKISVLTVLGSALRKD